MKSSPSVYIIIPSWNGLKHLRVCFESLMNLDYRNHRVILVDNGSQDGTEEFTLRHYPDVIIIKNRKNRGFARACNQGMRLALRENADYICLLNNDMEVCPDWLKKLVARAESDPTIGACASKLIYFYNRCFINGIGTCMNRHAVGWDQYNGRLDSDELHIEEECLGVCAGACLFRASVLKEVGLFDPYYTFYMEDTNLCLDLWKAGYRVVAVPGAIAYHKYSASMREGSPMKRYYGLRSRLYFMTKLFPLHALRWLLPEVLKIELQETRQLKWQKRYGHMGAQIRALMSYFMIAPWVLFRRAWLGGGFTPKTWAMVIPVRPVLPVKNVYSQDPAEKKKEPERCIVMDKMNDGLGTGWYAWEKEDGVFHRWTTKSATARLATGGRGGKTLRVCLSNPYDNLQRQIVHLAIAENEIAAVHAPASWQTVEVSFGTEENEIELTLDVDNVMKPELTGEFGDYGVRVRSIEIVSGDECVCGSPR